MSDYIDFDPPEVKEGEQADVTTSVSRIASLNARAVMPNGNELTREQILATLGLNPNTSPTAWLTVIGCGSNASALLPGDLQRIAVDRVAKASSVLNSIKGIDGGFKSGGALRDDVK